MRAAATRDRQSDRLAVDVDAVRHDVVVLEIHRLRSPKVGWLCPGVIAGCPDVPPTLVMDVDPKLKI